jgi:hypothetical protein
MSETDLLVVAFCHQYDVLPELMVVVDFHFCSYQAQPLIDKLQTLIHWHYLLD